MIASTKPSRETQILAWHVDARVLRWIQVRGEVIEYIWIVIADTNSLPAGPLPSVAPDRYYFSASFCSGSSFPGSGSLKRPRIQ